MRQFNLQQRSFWGLILGLLALPAISGCDNRSLQSTDDDDDQDESTDEDDDDDDDDDDASSPNDDDDDDDTSTGDDDDDDDAGDDDDDDDDAGDDDDDDDDGEDEETTESEDVTTEEEETSSSATSDTSDEQTTEDSSTETTTTSDEADCKNIEPTGGAGVGDILHDFSAPDQNGDMRTLHEYCKQGVAMVISTEWCGPCNDEAPQLQSMYENYKDKGVVIITLLVQQNSGQGATADTAQNWAQRHGLTHPVVAASEGKVQDFWEPLQGYPSFKVLKTGIEVAMQDPFPLRESHLEQIVP